MRSRASPVKLIFVLMIAVCAAMASSGSSLQQQKIALTFDDLPALGPMGFWRPREISNTILRVLEKHEIVAAGFVVEEKIDEDPAGFIVLEDWASRGHVLGNQTYADVDLNQLNAEDFLMHVADGQNYLRKIAHAYAINYRYLRYPFLRQGDSEGKKKKVAKALYNAGYQIAPVTVKTSDYRFNEPYLKHQWDQEKLLRLKSLFLAHVESGLEYAEEQSKKVFGRNINHILWLHAGIATAMFLDDLVQMLKKRGYEFISFPDALSDPAFEAEENYTGPLGLSFIDRIAASKGLPFDSDHGEISRDEIEKRLQH